jgi:hypothetical protein
MLKLIIHSAGAVVVTVAVIGAGAGTATAPEPARLISTLSGPTGASAGATLIFTLQHLIERGLASLQAKARQPPQRSALEPLRLGMPNRDADRQGVTEVDARQLGGGVADQGEVACLQGPPEASVR